MKSTRRTFIYAGGTMLAAQAAPSDQVNLGAIGSGGRGMYVMGVFQKDPNVRVGSVCDVYEPNLEKALSLASKAQGGQSPRAIRNYKQILDDKSINAVLIATPEHWHHRMTLDAIAAGKDIYVEKPLCQTPEQGMDLIRAEKASKCIVQVGMQRRSYDLYLEGRKIVAAGTLGPVRMVRSWWLNNYVNQPPPAKLDGPLDWEQWQGPVKRRVAVDPLRFRHWRYFSEYAGGIAADQGAHAFDGMHLLMDASYPLAVTAIGNKIQATQFDQPESMVTIAEYPEEFTGIFTINYAAMKYQSKNDQLSQLDGDKARMDIGREECRVYMQGAEDTVAIAKRSERGFGYAAELHVQNFLECVRTRKTPTAPMRIGFQACLVTLLANISRKTGRRVRWDDVAGKVIL
ncbi:MAG: Gfo/Idh/MocA family oxidoreductase [Acidobacteria bacterium]|nr:Gfo/Idh/MocA family oxidoreductase [Acidobacteriota bacterium]